MGISALLFFSCNTFVPLPDYVVHIVLYIPKQLTKIELSSLDFISLQTELSGMWQGSSDPSSTP